MGGKKNFIVFVSFFLAFQSFQAFAADLNVPEQTAWVMDSAGAMDSTEREELESYLENLNGKGGAQIAVFTVNSLEEAAGKETTVEEYANEVFEKWGLGQKNEDNGVLLLVSVNDRALRIEVGYGLEGVLTDTKCGIIIRKFITPYFKEGDYAKGIKSGVEVIAGYVSGDEDTKSEVDKAQEHKESKGEFLIPVLMFAVFFGIVFVSEFSARKKGKRAGGQGYKMSSGRRVYFDSGDDFSGFGGDSGGGFDGGGGGHSGGGGASGSW